MKNLKIKVILAVLVVIMSYNTCFAVGNMLKDIDDTNYEIPVYALRELGIMDGYPDYTFRPHATVTRAEMIKMIVSAYGLENLAKNNAGESTGFADVDMDYFVTSNISVKHWASGYIYVAKEYGFIDESPSKNFYPDENITYADAITYCLRILGYKNEIESNGNRPTNYISKAHDLKLLNGLTINSYDELATRGDIATLLWNVMNTKMWKNSSKTTETFMEIKYPNKVKDIKTLIEGLTEIIPTGITLSRSSVKICNGTNGVGGKFLCSVLTTPTITPKNVTDKSVVWTSSNNSIASIKDGYIIAKQKGSVVLTARTVNGLTASCNVEIVDHQCFTSTNYEYDENTHWQMSICNICLSDIEKQNVEKHTYVNGKCMCGKLEPQPTKIIPTGITLSRSSAKICIGTNGVGGKFLCSVLTAPIITPQNATDKSVVWTSNNNSIASIKDGYIIAKQKGSVVLTARTVNGLTASCNVEIVDHQCFIDTNYYEYDENTHWHVSTCAFCLNHIEKQNVENHTFVNGVCKCGKTSSKKIISTLEFETEIMNLELGRTKQLNLKITPDAANEKIIYSSDDTSCVTVDDNGKIKAVKAGGIVTITAKSERGKIATCKVVVPKGVVRKMTIGTSFDKDGLNSDDVWRSSDESIVTFEGEKYVAKKLGKCTLTAYLKDNSNILTTKVEVEVVETLDSNSINVVDSNDSITYYDVKETDWYKESVKYVTINNFMNGMGDNKFSPLSNMTRGMIVTVLYRMSKSSYDGKSTFVDVNESEYYSSAVAWADKYEIVNGIGDNKFAPNAEITREQLIVILYRYAKVMNIDVSVDESTNILSYDDFSEIAEYSISAFKWGCEKGIASGRTSTTLSPKGTATRAEVATMLMRFTEKTKID